MPEQIFKKKKYQDRKKSKVNRLGIVKYCEGLRRTKERSV